MDKSLAKLIKQIEKYEREISTALGGLVVLVVMVVTYQVYLKNRLSLTPSPEVEVLSSGESETAGEYVLQTGEGLSNVAERFYGNRELWQEIAKANNISNPDLVEVGTKLIIPDIGIGAGSQEAVEEVVVANVGKGKYVVKRGDYLAKIAIEVYGDSERWIDVLNANRDKIANPEILVEGTELVLPE